MQFLRHLGIYRKTYNAFIGTKLTKQLLVLQNVLVTLNILPVSAEMLTPLLLTFSNTEKRVNKYSVAAVRDETVRVTGPSPSGAAMCICGSLYWRTKLSLFTLLQCRLIVVSFGPANMTLAVTEGAETEKTADTNFSIVADMTSVGPLKTVYGKIPAGPIQTFI